MLARKGDRSENRWTTDHQPFVLATASGVPRVLPHTRRYANRKAAGVRNVRGVSFGRLAGQSSCLLPLLSAFHQLLCQ